MKAKAKITEVLSPWTSDDGTKSIYKFKAQIPDHEGPVKFDTWHKTISEALVQGIECEIEFTEKMKGDFMNRNVSQAWIDGVPIAEDKPKGQKQWQPRQDDSPEKRLSIERQSYVQNLPLFVGNKDIPSDLRLAICAWGRDLFKDYLPTSKDIKTEPQPQPASLSKAATPSDEAFEKLVSASETVVMKTLGDLFNQCHREWKMTKYQVLKVLGIEDQAEITNVGQAYLQVKKIKEGGINPQ